MAVIWDKPPSLRASGLGCSDFLPRARGGVGGRGRSEESPEATQTHRIWFTACMMVLFRSS